MSSRKNPWAISQRIGYASEDLSRMPINSITHTFGLNWGVTLQDVYTTDDNGTATVIPNRYATVRMDTNEPLEIVGKRYRITQNYDFMYLLDQLRKKGVAEFEAGGSIRNGKGVYAVMRLNDKVNLPNDPHAGFLIARTSHDGSCSIEVSPLLMRISCTNAITSAIMKGREKNALYRRKHTLYSNVCVEDLMVEVNIVKDFICKYESMAQHLIQERMDDGEFENFLVKQFWIPSKITNSPEEMLSRGEKVMRNKALAYRNFARTAWYGLNQDTQDNLRYTKFGALQAVIEAVDHRGKEMSESQATRIILDNDSDMKANALSLLVG